MSRPWGGQWPSPPTLLTPRRLVNTFDIMSSLAGAVQASEASATWSTTKFAMYCPIMAQAPMSITAFFVVNGASTSGNFEIGLYAADGTKLSSTGSTAQSGTNTYQSVSVTPFNIGAGLYFLAVTFDNTTATVRSEAVGAQLLRSLGFLEQDLSGSWALPATATFAAASMSVVPLAGMTGTIIGPNANIIAPSTITPWHTLSIGAAQSVVLGRITSATSGAWPAANRAFYVPFFLPSAIVATQLFFYAGTTSSNANHYDIGIYTADGTRIISTGSTAQSGSTSVLNVANITDTQLGPGSYMMALALDSTDHVFRSAPTFAVASGFGMYQQSSAFALPATATFATLASGAVIPVFGLITQTVI